MAGFEKLAGSDSYQANTVPYQAQQAIQAFLQAYPQLVQGQTSQLTPIAQGQLDAAKATTPGYNDLAVGELNRLAPGISQAQGALDAGQAANDVANLNTYGPAAGEAMRAADASANPEYYKNLAAVSPRFTEAINALSPTLSAGQRAEVERGTARLNPGGADNSAISTAEKAMSFGSAHQAQVSNFANAINSLASNIGSLRSGISPISTALGRDSRTAPAMAAITPVMKPDNTAYQMGGGVWNGLMGTANQNEQIAASKFKDWGDAFSQDSASVGNIAGSVKT